jgi:hypothetical protein
MSAGKAFSFSIGALLAAAVTVGLFIIMYSLIAMRDVNIDDDGGVRLPISSWVKPRSKPS